MDSLLDQFIRHSDKEEKKVLQAIKRRCEDPRLAEKDDPARWITRYCIRNPTAHSTPNQASSSTIHTSSSTINPSSSTTHASSSTTHASSSTIQASSSTIQASSSTIQASSSTIQAATGPISYYQQPGQGQPNAAAKLTEPGASRTNSRDDADSQNAGGSRPGTISVQDDGSSRTFEDGDMMDHDHSTQRSSLKRPCALPGPSTKRARQGERGSLSRPLTDSELRQKHLQHMKGLSKQVIESMTLYEQALSEEHTARETDASQAESAIRTLEKELEEERTARKTDASQAESTRRTLEKELEEERTARESDASQIVLLEQKLEEEREARKAEVAKHTELWGRVDTIINEAQKERQALA